MKVINFIPLLACLASCSAAKFSGLVSNDKESRYDIVSESEDSLHIEGRYETGTIELQLKDNTLEAVNLHDLCLYVCRRGEKDDFVEQSGKVSVKGNEFLLIFHQDYLTGFIDTLNGTCPRLKNAKEANNWINRENGFDSTVFGMLLKNPDAKNNKGSLKQKDGFDLRLGRTMDSDQSFFEDITTEVSEIAKMAKYAYETAKRRFSKIENPVLRPIIGFVSSAVQTLSTTPTKNKNHLSDPSFSKPIESKGRRLDPFISAKDPFDRNPSHELNLGFSDEEALIVAIEESTREAGLKDPIDAAGLEETNRLTLEMGIKESLKYE